MECSRFACCASMPFAFILRALRAEVAAEEGSMAKDNKTDPTAAVDGYGAYSQRRRKMVGRSPER